ncbi:MAG: glycosyltransferase family 4 protein [Vicinamibacterales bacterium]
MTPLPPVGGRPPRLAWFSPIPPSSSGIAAYSADLVPVLRGRGLHVDVYAELDEAGDGRLDALDARDFVWRRRRQPYDLAVYHLGNARCHDYMWGYLFNVPGLVVLHDAQVHQARARALLQRYRPRLDDYLAEFAAMHPDAPPAIAHLVAAGLGGSLYAHWPHVRLVLRAARLAAVHSPQLAQRLQAAHGADVAVVPMGVPDPLAPAPAASSSEIRRRHGVPDGAVLVGAFGGVTPEKRLPELLRAVAAAEVPAPLHVLIVGAPAGHYDVLADAAAHGVADRVHVTGFVADADLPAYLAAVDLCACLRWPSNGETSASWWRAMAAGKATVITDLVHQPEIPVLDPRDWRPLGAREDTPVAVAIPILDEHQALVHALEGLARSPDLRAALGAAARDYWRRGHTVDAMADGYEAVVDRALARRIPEVELPPHLVATGDERMTALLAPFGIGAPPGLAAESNERR